MKELRFCSDMNRNCREQRFCYDLQKLKNTEEFPNESKNELDSREFSIFKT